MSVASRSIEGVVPIAQMRRSYLAGDSNETIARRLGLHQSKVRCVLLAAGVKMRSRREQVALRTNEPACVSRRVGSSEPAMSETG